MNSKRGNDRGAEKQDKFSTLNDAKALEGRADRECNVYHWADANRLLLEALEKRKSSLGSDDPSVANVLERIAETYIRLNRLPEAENAATEAVRILEASFHPGHAMLAPALEREADILIRQDRLTEAEPLMKRSADIYTNTMTMENRSTLRAFYKLAKLYVQIDKPEEAKKVIEKAMKHVDTPLGPVGEFRYQMALAQVLSKNNIEAKQLLKDASEDFRQRNNYLRVVDCLKTYAEICRNTGEDIQAEVALREADRYRGLDNFYPEDIFVATLMRA